MATLRTLSVCKQLSTTWCKRKYAFVCSSCITNGPPNFKDRRWERRLKEFKERSTKFRSVSDKRSMIRPKPSPDIYIERELDKDAVRRILSLVGFDADIKKLCKEHEIDHFVFKKTFVSFSTMCLEGELSSGLHSCLHDLITSSSGTEKVVALFPYFLEHSQGFRQQSVDLTHLYKCTDLTSPAQWYPGAREKTRKIIIHVGPTNSGKTYNAMERFLLADSATYCCPLRMLAMEVCKSSNEQGVPCDMKTGELITYADELNLPGSHVACTVEMASMVDSYEVAVIDEIQMIRDLDRGWAWTRAFLGLMADEIHLCGEESAVPLIKNLAQLTGDTVEVKTYNRLTPLKYLNKPVESLSNVLPGDCIVCFNKQMIFRVSAALNKYGVLTAIIYGNLPPATKIAQAKKFNDPMDPCKVLVATDAIGMGVNLNIKRIIFVTLIKKVKKKNGRIGDEMISTSLARHIAGRAGRFGTLYPNGEVTTFRKSELPKLQKLIKQKVKPIQSAGLKPTPEQMELFSYNLPDASLKELLEMFEGMAKHDEKNFFLCKLHHMKKLADLIDGLGLPMKEKFHYATAPIDIDSEQQCNAFVKCAMKHSNKEPMSISWLTDLLGWPLQMPKTLSALKSLEGIFNCLDNYLWFSKFYPEIYQGDESVREIQKELEIWIEEGLVTCLLENLSLSEKRRLKMQAATGTESAVIPDEQEVEKEATERDSAEPTSTHIESTDKIETVTQLDSTDKSETVSGLLSYLKKGGISEKRLKKLSKKLQFNPNYAAPKSQIGKHPRKVRTDKKQSVKNLRKILKDIDQH